MMERVLNNYLCSCIREVRLAELQRFGANRLRLLLIRCIGMVVCGEWGVAFEIRRSTLWPRYLPRQSRACACPCSSPCCAYACRHPVRYSRGQSSSYPWLYPPVCAPSAGSKSEEKKGTLRCPVMKRCTSRSFFRGCKRALRETWYPDLRVPLLPVHADRWSDQRACSR